jgi:hypothetical protein
MGVQQKQLRKPLEQASTNNGGQTLTGDVTVDSTALSWAAETADGTRDERMVLTLEDGKNLKVKKASDMNPNDPELATVYTPNKQHRSKIELPGTDAWDSVFWTESSVEKFLWPYYHAHRLWDEHMTELRAQFETDPMAVAVAHKAPSASATLPLSGVDVTAVARATKDKGGARSLAWHTGREYLRLKQGT